MFPAGIQKTSANRKDLSMKSILMGGNALFQVYSPEIIDFLQKNAELVIRPVSKKEILQAPETYADTAYIFTTWGMDHFTQEEIKRCLPKLKAVFYGAGSVQYFAREFLNSGVRVFSAWGANAVPVAEYTVAQILLANKGFFQACSRFTSQETRANAAAYFGSMPGNYGCNVGIIGAGMIGKMVIRRLADYNLNVLVYDPFLSDEAAKELKATKVSLEDLFSSCQTISNHVANLPQTVGMLNAACFQKMKKNATFINTGRGAQVVEKDLIAVLKQNPDITAVLDVTDPEPPEADSELYTLPNVFLTPHIAGSAGQEVARMGEYMKDQFIKVQQNAPCEYEVTLKMLETMA